MARKKKAAEPGFNIFQCQLCADKPEFDGSVPGTFSAHLAEAHQMDAKAKYRKETVSHLDARDWYEWNYRWLVGDTVFAIQSVRNPRHPNDLMYADE